jgi:hypothetical protein
MELSLRFSECAFTAIDHEAIGLARLEIDNILCSPCVLFDSSYVSPRMCVMMWSNFSHVAQFYDCGMVDQYFKHVQIGHRPQDRVRRPALLITIEIVSLCAAATLHEEFYQNECCVCVHTAILADSCALKRIRIDNRFLETLAVTRNSECKEIIVDNCNNFIVGSRDPNRYRNFHIRGQWDSLNYILFQQSSFDNTVLDFSDALFGEQKVNISFSNSHPARIILPKVTTCLMEIYFVAKFDTVKLVAHQGVPPKMVILCIESFFFYCAEDRTYYVAPTETKIDENYLKHVKEITCETEFSLCYKHFRASD